MREWFTGDGIKVTHLYLMNCKIPKESMEGLMMILGERYALLVHLFPLMSFTFAFARV